MILWTTDNNISQAVMAALSHTGHKVMHISKFDETPLQPSVFYGILRGTSRAMHIMKYMGIDYHYVDNGYIDAFYINKNKLKNLNGTYRLVKNDMIEPYGGVVNKSECHTTKKTALLIPPTFFTANHYDTMPEDWVNLMFKVLTVKGYEILLRDKNVKTPLDEDLAKASIVVNFNSMAAMRAIELGIPVYDSHWIFRNIADLFSDFTPTIYAAYKDVKEYYLPRQFTLEQMRNWNA